MNDEIELDRRLKQMVLTAQQHPAQSRERQKTLDTLVKDILSSGELSPTGNNSFSQDNYDEALQNVLMYFCQHIEIYDFTQGFLISGLKALMFKKFYREVKYKELEKSSKKITLSSELEEQILIQSKSYLSEILIKCIQIDPENIFRERYIENYPNANFQALVGLRIEKFSWQEISVIMGIKPSTLRKFYQRSIEKFKAKIKYYVESYEE